MKALKLIKINSKGADVERWEYFLRGRGFYNGEVDRLFDEETLQATIAFQKRYNLQPDGIVGNKTYGVAMFLGFEGVVDEDRDKRSMNWPAKPSFSPLIANEQRQQVFGKFDFVHEPLPNNPENIRITGNWQKDNIVLVHVPQLIPIKGSDKVWFHKKCAAQLIQLWKDWDDAELLHHVLTWDGAFVPRFVRGSRKTLSNHAFGSAFDINAAWNGLGITPPLVGQKGSVRELVEMANKNGFYWGGHFDRKDGMHFEVAKILL
jgi:hypothetical protein